MFRKLLTLDEAKKTIHRFYEPKPLGVKQIPLLKANNRVLAEELTSWLTCARVTTSPLFSILPLRHLNRFWQGEFFP